MQKKLKICILGSDWNSSKARQDSNGYGGVTYYRLIAPLLGSKDFDVTYHGADLHKEALGKLPTTFWKDFMSRYDIYIIKHIDNPEAASNLCFFAQKYKKLLILDLDDNLFEVKEDQPAYELYKQGTEKRAVVSALLSFVDALFVSTQPLADYFTKWYKDVFDMEKPIYVLPNYNNIEDWNFKKKENKGKDLTIGWIGSTTHFSDLQIVIPAIERLLKEYPNLHLNLIGGVSHEEAIKLFKDVDESVLERVGTNGGTHSWQGYPEYLSTIGFDIGIAPITDCEFNRAKSHIKWIEYSMYEIPTVCSDVYPYSKNVKHSLLAKDDEWYDKLKSLIDSKDLREELGKKSKEYIIENLQYKDHKGEWTKAIKELVSQYQK